MTMKKILSCGTLGLVFLLPWQTVWIIQEKMIGPESLSVAQAGAMGLWQYGTLRIYAVEFLIITLAVISVLCRYDHRGIPFRDRRRHIIVIALLLFAGLSIFWSDDRLVALFAWVRLCEGAFLFTLFRNTSLKWSWIVGAWIGAAVIQSTLGIWQFLVQEVSANSWLGIAAHYSATLGDAVVQAGDRRWLRAYGAFPHPNIFGAYLSVSMLWCAQALCRAQKKQHWLLLVAVSQLILGALLVSFSRGAWIVLLVAAVCALAVGIKKNGRGLKNFFAPVIHPGVLLVLASAITISAFSLTFFEELKVRTGFAESRLEVQSVSERIDSYARAVPLVEHVWLVGTGVGNFTNTLFRFEQAQGTVHEWYTYQPIHNVFVMVFVELGIIGLVFLVCLGVLLLRRMPVSMYPFLGAIAVLSLFDHFLWTLPFGIFMVAILSGMFSAQGLTVK